MVDVDLYIGALNITLLQCITLHLYIYVAFVLKHEWGIKKKQTIYYMCVVPYGVQPLVAHRLFHITVLQYCLRTGLNITPLFKMARGCGFKPTIICIVLPYDPAYYLVHVVLNLVFVFKRLPASCQVRS